MSVTLEDLIHSDFLTNSNGDIIPRDYLKGKTVVIFLVAGLKHPLSSSRLHNDLFQICHQLRDEAFETVLVLTGEEEFSTPSTSVSSSSWQLRRHKKSPEEVFSEALSNVPWLFLPYSNRNARLRIRDMIIGSRKSSRTTLLLNTSGEILTFGETSDYLFSEFGSEGFPFTKDRILQIGQQDKAVLENPSLHTLLRYSSQFLFSADGKQVAISELEGKVVGLYFYQDEEGKESKLTKRIKKIYHSCKDQGFEIVLVNLDFTYVPPQLEKSFWNNLQDMPWLALPFQDPNCRRLHRIFNHPSENRRAVLPIIGPYGSYMEVFGCDIMCRYGKKAYPFTRKKVVELEMRELEKLRLESIFDTNTIFIGEDGSEVHLEQILGKKVLLLFYDDWLFRPRKFLKMLEEQYTSNKGTDSEFEVVHIILNIKRRTSPIPKMPWLVHPFSYPLLKEVPVRIFKRCSALSLGLVAFGEDGSFIGKESLNAKKREWIDTFPFIIVDLKEEILKDLRVAYDWRFSTGLPLREMEPLFTGSFERKMRHHRL